MQISNTTSNSGIFQDIDFFALTDSTSYPLTDKARNVNRHYQKAIIDVLKAAGKFEGSSELSSTDNLVSGTQEYTLPSDLLGLSAIEVKNADGDWVRLRPIDKFSLPNSISDYQNTPGMPAEYDVQGTKVTLYPAPLTGSVTTTNGIKYFYQGEVSPFVSTDTTPEPSIPEPFHRILSLGAACDYLIVNGPTDRHDRLKQEYEQLRTEFRSFLSTRNKDVHIGIRPAHRTSSYE